MCTLISRHEVNQLLCSSDFTTNTEKQLRSLIIVLGIRGSIAGRGVLRNNSEKNCGLVDYLNMAKTASFYTTSYLPVTPMDMHVGYV
jgi:hypothetical protein